MWGIYLVISLMSEQKGSLSLIGYLSVGRWLGSAILSNISGCVFIRLAILYAYISWASANCNAPVLMWSKSGGVPTLVNLFVFSRCYAIYIISTFSGSPPKAGRTKLNFLAISCSYLVGLPSPVPNDYFKYNEYFSSVSFFSGEVWYLG
jgi:hypothetical protein